MTMIDKNYLIQCFIEDVKYVDASQTKRDAFLFPYNKWSKEFQNTYTRLNDLKRQTLSSANPSRLQCFCALFFAMPYISESIRQENFLICVPELMLSILVVIMHITIAMMVPPLLKSDSYFDVMNFNIHVNSFIAHLDKKMCDINKKLGLVKNSSSLRIIKEDLLLPQCDSLPVVLSSFCGISFDDARMFAVISTILLLALNAQLSSYIYILVWILFTFLMLLQCLSLRRCSIYVKAYKTLLKEKENVLFRWHEYDCCNFQAIFGEGGYNCVPFLKLIQWNSEGHSTILNPLLVYTTIVVQVACRLEQNIYSRNFEGILECLFFSKSSSETRVFQTLNNPSQTKLIKTSKTPDMNLSSSSLRSIAAEEHIMRNQQKGRSSDNGNCFTLNDDRLSDEEAEINTCFNLNSHDISSSSTTVDKTAYQRTSPSILNKVEMDSADDINSKGQCSSSKNDNIIMIRSPDILRKGHFFIDDFNQDASRDYAMEIKLPSASDTLTEVAITPSHIIPEKGEGMFLNYDDNPTEEILSPLKNTNIFNALKSSRDMSQNDLSLPNSGGEKRKNFIDLNNGTNKSVVNNEKPNQQHLETLHNSITKKIVLSSEDSLSPWPSADIVSSAENSKKESAFSDMKSRRVFYSRTKLRKMETKECQTEKAFSRMCPLCQLLYDDLIKRQTRFN